MSNVVPLRSPVSGLRNVLRGAERDAAIQEAAGWYRQQQVVVDALNTIAERFNLSLTASAQAILLAGGQANG